MKNRKTKRSQVNVIEFVLLLSISLLVVYEIYLISENLKKNLMDRLYFDVAYLTTNFVITSYMEKKLLKDSLKAEKIYYKYYLPERLLPSGYYIKTRNVTINGEQKRFLIMYSYDLPVMFKMSYKINKDFFAHPGINEEEVK